MSIIEWKDSMGHYRLTPLWFECTYNLPETVQFHAEGEVCRVPYLPRLPILFRILRLHSVDGSRLILTYAIVLM